MSASPTASANSTTFGNSTSWGGSFNSTSTGNSTGWGTSSDDTWGVEFWVPVFNSHVGAKRLAICFLTWVAYDFAITVEDSINLFWKYRWSFSKAMYLISRYDSLFTMGAIVAQLHVENPSLSIEDIPHAFLLFEWTLQFCIAAPWVVMAGATILIIVINLAMITRVYALWNRDRRILIFSLFGFSLNIGSYVILLSYSYAKGFTFVNLPPFTGCITWPGSDKLWIMFITSIGFESMIVCLTVYKAWSVAVQRGIRTPLYTLILEDGVVYFIIIILSQVLTIAALYIPSSITGPIAGSSPSIAVSGIACNRLFTRLQRLLLDKSRDQGGLATEDFATSSEPQTSYGGAIIKQQSPSPRRSRQQSPNETLQQRRSSLGTRLSKHLRSGDGGGGSSDIVMENVSRTSTQNHDSGIRGRLERSSWRGHTPRHDHRRMSGSLDKEIDLSGHYQAIEAVRKSHDLLDHQKPPREGEVQVQQSVAVETWGDPRMDDDLLSSHENDGPFTYGGGKSVLDPSPRSPGEHSNTPDDDVGRLIVSRVGRYD